MQADYEVSFKKKKKRKPKVKAKATSKTLPPNFLTVFEKEARLEAQKQIRQFAEEIAEEARDIIKEQRYDWVPLDPDYLASKIKKGLDPRTLIATGDYLDHIGTYEKDGKIFVGPLPGTHKPSGLTYVHLARIHEYGTETIPARPLWRPLFSVALRRNEKLRKKYAAARKKALREAIKRKSKKKVKRSS